MTKYLILLLVFILAGCSTTKVSAPLVVEATKQLVVDQQLLKPCVPIPKLKPSAQLVDIETHYIELIGLYGQCAQQQQASIRAIKSLANLPD